MRIAIIVAGLTLSLTAVTAASSATQSLVGTGIAPSDSASKAGVMMAAASTGMVPKHHPHYHHYKHHYRSHPKSGTGKT